MSPLPRRRPSGRPSSSGRRSPYRSSTTRRRPPSSRSRVSPAKPPRSPRNPPEGPTPDTPPSNPFRRRPSTLNPQPSTRPSPQRPPIDRQPSTRPSIHHQPSTINREDRPTVLWGRRVVTEALRAGRPIRRLYFGAQPTAQSPLGEIETLARRQHIPIQVLERRALDRIADTDRHQNVAAEILEHEYAALDDLFAVARHRDEAPFLLVLDAVQDPQNLGSLIRTAEAVGAHGVILPRHRAAGVTASVARASAGAIEHLQVAEVVNLNRTVDELKERGLWIVGLDAEGEATLEQVDPAGPLCVVVGSEGKGLSRLLSEKCDWLVKLPMRGKIGSLNAAIAGSIVLYDLFRRRTAAPL
ncbi:MAG TPA: 23S rRNA (guanosine(2251)-2'-O)-methyltransferase RlmB [Candidatus Limnocylindrales bacterium]|nr:23S rRNA (guanosine(2251)-2'-O)-methyltransferase RlmB [Candidatus Limnocylindrales bacterium]